MADQILSQEEIDAIRKEMKAAREAEKQELVDDIKDADPEAAKKEASTEEEK